MYKNVRFVSTFCKNIETCNSDVDVGVVWYLIDISDLEWNSVVRWLGNSLLIPSLGVGFNLFVIFTPTWGNDPIWLIFFRWVGSTTN